MWVLAWTKGVWWSGSQLKATIFFRSCLRASHMCAKSGMNTPIWLARPKKAKRAETSTVTGKSDIALTFSGSGLTQLDVSRNPANLSWLSLQQLEVSFWISWCAIQSRCTWSKSLCPRHSRWWCHPQSLKAMVYLGLPYLFFNNIHQSLHLSPLLVWICSDHLGAKMWSILNSLHSRGFDSTTEQHPALENTLITSIWGDRVLKLITSLQNAFRLEMDAWVFPHTCSAITWREIHCVFWEIAQP